MDKDVRMRTGIMIQTNHEEIVLLRMKLRCSL